MAKQKTNVAKKQPDIKCKAGVFQLAGWKRNKVVPAPKGMEDFMPEREIEQWNICFTGAMRNNGEWKNIAVWFRLSQFGNLQQVVDGFTEKMKEFIERENEKAVS